MPRRTPQVPSHAAPGHRWSTTLHVPLRPSTPSATRRAQTSAHPPTRRPTRTRVHIRAPPTPTHTHTLEHARAVTRMRAHATTHAQYATHAHAHAATHTHAHTRARTRAWSCVRWQAWGPVLTVCTVKSSQAAFADAAVPLHYPRVLLRVPCCPAVYGAVWFTHEYP
jgi:hypothetical protein